MRKLDSDVIRRITVNQTFLGVDQCVKELVENSLDAGSRRIDVVLVDNGLFEIKVSDNGLGIAAEYRISVGKPHHTSKLPNCSFADMDSLQTYGFRGEALANLCTLCSELKIATKTREDSVGSEWSLHSSNFKSLAMNCGTVVTCRGLYSNLPVRRNILLESGGYSSLKRTVRIIKAYSAIRPDVRFSLTRSCSDGTKVSSWSRPACDDYRESYALTYGAVTAENLHYFSVSEGRLHILALLPDFENYNCNAFSPEPTMFYVNQRPMSNACASIKSLTNHLRRLYHEKTLMQRMSNGSLASSTCKRYPMGFVALTVPPEEVDINLEPNKDSVLLANRAQAHTLLEKLFDRNPSCTLDGIAVRKANALVSSTAALSHGTAEISPRKLEPPDSDKKLKQLPFTKYLRLSNRIANLSQISTVGICATATREKVAAISSLATRNISPMMNLTLVAALDPSGELNPTSRLYIVAWRKKLLVFRFLTVETMAFVVLKHSRKPKLVAVPHEIQETVQHLLAIDLICKDGSFAALKLLKGSLKDSRNTWLSAL